jgi:hypothetical protein
MDDQLRRADFVLVVCTGTYCERFEQRAESGVGLGAKYEGAIISDEIYQGEGDKSRFIPVIFSLDDRKEIPSLLRDATYYDVSTENGFERLYRHLTQQPLWPATPLGAVRRFLPSIPRRSRFPSIEVDRPAEEAGDFRLLAGHDTERITTVTTTIITQKKTVEPLSNAFDRYEFFFWQDADGPVDFARSDVLGQISGRPIHHSMVELQHDMRQLRLQLVVDRPRPFGEPLTFIAQVSCEDYYPHLFSTGTGYTALQVRQPNPSYTYRLELPNRSPFRDVKVTVAHRRDTTELVSRPEGGDLIHEFGPASLDAGDNIRFSLSNLALLR